MQFKKRGTNIIQLIRYAGYDKDKKRATTELIGSFPSYATKLDQVDAEVLAKLTTDEHDELVDFLNKALVERTKFVSDNALGGLLATIEQCKLALEAGTKVADPDQVFVALRDLAQAMVKAGYKRPKFTEKKPVDQKEQQKLPID